MVLEETAPPRAGVGARPKVVIYDPVSWTIKEWSYEVERARLETHGVDFVVPTDEADSDRQIVDADVVIVTAIRGRLDAAAIDTLQRAVGLVCASTGMNQVDLVAAAARNIPVRNTPFCIDEVSEHALTLLLMVERRIPRIANRTAEGHWDFGQQPEYWQIRRLKGRTLGIIGVGRIGREVARKAQALGYRTIAYDPNVSDPGNPGIQMLPLATVMAEADVIVTCADLNPTSRHIIGRDSLAHVRPGTLFVNVARGGLVDEEALADALRDGRIAMAALDVRASEPPNADNDPLAGLPNLILTPHMAGASVEARETLHTMTADVTLELLAAAGRLASAG